MLGQDTRGPSGAVEKDKRISNLMVLLMVLGFASQSYSQTIPSSTMFKSVAAQPPRTASSNDQPSGAPKKREAASQPGSSGEVEQLRNEVGELRAEIDRLRSLIEAAVTSRGGDSRQAT